MRNRTLPIAIALGLLGISGCSPNGAADLTEAATPDTASTTSADPTTTQGGATNSPGTTTTTTTAAPTTTEPPPTTTIAEGDPAIRIDEIVFVGDPYLLLANRGTGAGTTGEMWICQFPNYFALPAVELGPGDRIAIPLGDGEVPDLVGVVASVEAVRPLGPISRSSGEIGLYSTDTFNAPEAIVDYVEWGQADHARSIVAVRAGIWVEGGFIEMAPEVLAIVAEIFPTTGPEDWHAEIGG